MISPVGEYCQHMAPLGRGGARRQGRPWRFRVRDGRTRRYGRARSLV